MFFPVTFLIPGILIPAGRGAGEIDYYEIDPSVEVYIHGAVQERMTVLRVLVKCPPRGNLMAFPVGRFKPPVAGQYIHSAIFIDIAGGDPFRNKIAGQYVLFKFRKGA